MDIFPSEIHALVGESGSGKSTLSLAVLRLLEMKGGSANGRLQFNGCDLMNLSERKMREVRGRQISLVLQSPHSSLNPALRIGTQLNEAWHAHANGAGAERDAKISTALDNVSLPADADFLRRYPSQLSVGQAQRVLIAMAILHRPLLLIADEPTSALDVITQSEILELFARLNRDLGTAILYISHDLLSVASLCHRLSILYEGTIVETGPTRQIFERPTHPYTRRLLEALPQSPFSVPQPSARLA
jgi:ABC-type dipeptide/oligopeptide/nickel transport system ATPase component